MNLKIIYVKAPNFRASLINGAYGGVSPSGMINANFFLDQGVMPNMQVVEITDSGKLGDIIEEVKEGDIYRETQFGALMDVKTAKLIIKWLQEKVEEQEKLLKVKDDAS